MEYCARAGFFRQISTFQIAIFHKTNFLSSEVLMFMSLNYEDWNTANLTILE